MLGGEHGASGTVYLKHMLSNYTILRIDNKGQQALDSEIHNSGYRLDLSGGTMDRSTIYTAASGVTVTSSCGIYCYSYCSPPITSCHYYSLAYLFHQRFSSSACYYYLAACTHPKLTFDFKKEYFVNHIRVYPLCSSGMADFKVSLTNYRATIR